MDKAHCVCALILRNGQCTQLFFERRVDGVWTLLGGEVQDHESEHDAIMRYSQEYSAAVRNLAVIEQIGPLYQLPGGRTLRAYICEADVLEGEMERYAQWRFFEKEDLLTSVEVSSAIERAAWDGFSVLEQCTPAAKQTAHGVTGIYCDPAREHVLVEETGDIRREWPRLDPKSGRPMQAA